MAKARFCQCPPVERKVFESDSLFSVEEIPVKYVIYRREGYYDVKKLIERVWVPSPTVCPDYQDALHLCKRFYWCHVGLGSAPIWFVWPKFPGWVKKSPTPIIFRPDQLVCEYPPTIMDEDESAKQKEDFSALKKSLDDELARLAF